MSSFRLAADPSSQQQFLCILVRDLTDPFIHPIVPGLTHYSGTDAFVNWLMKAEGKDNLNKDKGVVASTVSWAELMNFDNPA